MATTLVSLAQGGNELVAAQSGRIIRVHRVLGEPGSDSALRSGDDAITPEMKIGSSGTLDVCFDPGDVCTARGEALNANSLAVGSTTVWIKYDVVD
jgi:hypothetical protein